MELRTIASRMRTNIARELNSAVNSHVVIGKQLAAVDTGFMRDNIKQIQQATPDTLEAVAESEADYSIYVEFGTVNMGAQPFFTPAFESAKKQLFSGLKGVLE